MLERRLACDDPGFEQFMSSTATSSPRSAVTRRAAGADRAAHGSHAGDAQLDESQQLNQLQQLSDQLLEDMDLRWQMDQLGQNLQQLFPQYELDQRPLRGPRPMGFAQAMTHAGAR